MTLALALSTLPLVVTALADAPPDPDTTAWVGRETFVMGTRFAVTVEASSRKEALYAAEKALRAVEHLDGLLSTWDRESALARVNASPMGRVQEPPPEVARLLASAERWARLTGRAFDPSVGALIDAWGLRGEGYSPNGVALADALRASGPAGVRVNPRTGAVTLLRRGAWLDAGGFGKGAALAAAGRALKVAGIRSGAVDLGGQVLVVGAPPTGTRGWTVGVAHPSHRDRAVARLRLRSVSAATSGASERSKLVGSERIGHIFDPRSGRPVPAWGSVTIVAADPFEADVLSTALFVMGPDGALAWAKRHPSLAALVLESEGSEVRARWTPAMEAWLLDAPGRPGDGVALVGPSPDHRDERSNP